VNKGRSAAKFHQVDGGTETRRQCQATVGLEERRCCFRGWRGPPRAAKIIKRHVVCACERAADLGAHAVATADTAHTLVGSVNRDDEP
jgi:hypothetical protein